MKSHTILAAILLFAPFGFAQEAASQAVGEAVLVTLATPVFLPLARQANVEGDVVVAVSVHPDGTAEASVVSGHPLLAQSALERETVYIRVPPLHRLRFVLALVQVHPNL